MSKLTEIGLKFGTDKARFHHFTDFYEKHLSHLRNKEIKLLEIGIFKGESLKMWKEYFPNATIYGADILDMSSLQEDRILIETCNQEDSESLKKLFSGEVFDIIVDDGGHTMLQQQLTLLHLLPRVKSGGLFIMEDLHTSVNRTWGYMCNKTNLKTTFELLTQTKESFNPNELYPSKEKYAVSSADIDTINSYIQNITIWLNKDYQSITSIITTT